MRNNNASFHVVALFRAFFHGMVAYTFELKEFFSPPNSISCYYHSGFTIQNSFGERIRWESGKLKKMSIRTVKYSKDKFLEVWCFRWINWMLLLDFWLSTKKFMQTLWVYFFLLRSQNYSVVPFEYGDILTRKPTLTHLFLYVQQRLIFNNLQNITNNCIVKTCIIYILSYIFPPTKYQRTIHVTDYFLFSSFVVLLSYFFISSNF